MFSPEWRQFPATALYSLILAFTVLFAFAAGFADAGALTGLAPGLAVRNAASGLQGVVNFCVIDKDRAFLLSKSGLMWLWDKGAITRIVNLSFLRPLNIVSESGLVDCAVNGNRLYTFYSTRPNQVLSYWNFNRTSGAVDLTSERVILRIPTQTTVYMHVGSGLTWSRGKRYLFITSGDHAACEIGGYFEQCTRVQSVDSYTGKVLRVDPNTGNGVRTNPHWNGNPRSVRSRIWAMGFRNPWSAVTIPGTDDLLIFDVGRVGIPRESLSRVPG
jgi:glucose/arabinose dehydrogenase